MNRQDLRLDVGVQAVGLHGGGTGRDALPLRTLRLAGVVLQFVHGGARRASIAGDVWARAQFPEEPRDLNHGHEARHAGAPGVRDYSHENPVRHFSGQVHPVDMTPTGELGFAQAA